MPFTKENEFEVDISGTFFITWTPYMCIALHKTLGMEGQINLSKEITLIPLVAAKTAGLWHPLVFGFINKDIRNVIRSEVSQCCQTFCINRLSRFQSSRRSKSHYERSDHQENEVVHKNNTYQKVDNASSDQDEKPVNSSPQATSEV
jgi:hypothetical protein